MYFDVEAESRVRTLWRALSEFGAGSYLEDIGTVPHISLAIFEQLDHTRAFAALSRFVESCEPLTIRLRSVDTFATDERVIFLAVEPSEELSALQAEFHGFLRSMTLSSSPLYYPGRWVPHCTIAQYVPPALFNDTVQKARDLFRPFDATLLEIGLVEYPPVRICWRRGLA